MVPNPSLEEALKVIRKYAPTQQPHVGLILGSGLGSLVEQMTNVVTIPFQALPGIPAGSVSGHASLLLLGNLNGVSVACLKGRLHLYEGVSYAPIQSLIRILKLLGCATLIITSAAGSLREEVGAGELMMVTDHINMQPGNPLVGPNDETFGPRFVSLENAYNLDLREQLQAVAQRLHIKLHEGVYLSTLGPVFETPAEIRAFKILGGDSVGMSVVPEVILARHCGMQVVAVNAITNLAVGLSPEKVTHDLTLRYAEIAARNLTKLVAAFVGELALAP